MLKLGADDGAKTDTAGPMDTAGTSASSPRKCAVSSMKLEESKAPAGSR